jgi:hypothetical protein
MTRVAVIGTIAERFGLSPVEFFAIEVASVFATDQETAARYIAKILEGSPYAGADCQAAVKRCVDKCWLEVSSQGMLAPTREGTATMQQISSELSLIDAGLPTAASRGRRTGVRGQPASGNAG